MASARRHRSRWDNRLPQVVFWLGRGQMRGRQSAVRTRSRVGQCYRWGAKGQSFRPRWGLGGRRRDWPLVALADLPTVTSDPIDQENRAKNYRVAGPLAAGQESSGFPTQRFL